MADVHSGTSGFVYEEIKYMTLNRPDLSVIVPVYNEENVIKSFTDHLLNVLNSINMTCNMSWEIVFVDDGSLDNTFEIIKTLAVSSEKISGVRFSRNFGKEAAMLAGLEHAEGRAVLMIDGDGQHPPEYIKQLVVPWQAGKADIVMAVKSERKSDSVWSRANAHLFNWFMEWATGMNMTGASDFQLLDRRVVQSILQMKERNRFFRGLSNWAGFRVVRVPFNVDDRMGGESKWSTLQLIRLAVTGITSFSARPLNLVMGLGACGLGVGFILLIQALWSWFIGIDVPGWTSLTIVILFFGSANLVAVGLVGIYLAKIFEEVKARPIYLVQETTRTLDSVKLDEDVE